MPMTATVESPDFMHLQQQYLPVLDGVEFPPVERLFADHAEAHAEMMAVVAELLKDIKHGNVDCPFPPERLFVKSMERLWLELWSKYAPPP